LWAAQRQFLPLAAEVAGSGRRRDDPLANAAHNRDDKPALPNFPPLPCAGAARRGYAGEKFR